MEKTKANISGVAPSASEQELPSISSPAADVIDVGKWNHGVKRAGFKALTLEEWRLLAVKLHSSQHVKVLNLSGNDMSTEIMRELVEPLRKLTALQEINLRGIFIGGKVAGILVEPLGKLTALKKLDLACTVSGLGFL